MYGEPLPASDLVHVLQSAVVTVGLLPVVQVLLLRSRLPVRVYVDYLHMPTIGFMMATDFNP